MSLTLEKIHETKLFIWLEGGTTEDNRPGCESRIRPCANQACWKLIQPCCGDVTLLCDPCRRHEEKWQPDYLRRGAICRACSAPVHALSSWEPLHG